MSFESRLRGTLQKVCIARVLFNQTEHMFAVWLRHHSGHLRSGVTLGNRHGIFYVVIFLPMLAVTRSVEIRTVRATACVQCGIIFRVSRLWTNPQEYKTLPESWALWTQTRSRATKDSQALDLSLTPTLTVGGEQIQNLGHSFLRRRVCLWPNP